LVSDSEPNALLKEHLSLKTACSQVTQCAWPIQQPIGVEINGSSKSRAGRVIQQRRAVHGDSAGSGGRDLLWDVAQRDAQPGGSRIDLDSEHDILGPR
jgi:hypothetical protein